MKTQVETPKKICVPLEEALDTAGVGRFTAYLMVVTGLVQFSALNAIQIMSNIIPAAGCDLGLTGFEKGLLTSSGFSGMIFSSLFAGSLADRFGRRAVMVFCGASNAICALVASLSPTPTILLIIWVINGVLLAGVFSPIFVYVSEFCPVRIRAMGVLLPSCMGAVATIYLPSMAWLILPLQVSIPIYGSFVLTSWRIFLAVLSIPTALSTFLLYTLPESPKFTLNQGNEEETLSTLRRIYAMNNKKSKKDFPILSVSLDESDRIAVPKPTEGSNMFMEMLRMLMRQFVGLFTPPLLPYTLLSSGILTICVGLYNGLYLWLPEQLRVLMHHYSNNPDDKATLCQILYTGNDTVVQTDDSSCMLNEDIFVIGSMTATIQCIFIVAVGFLADRFGRKPFLVMFSVVALGGCISLIYANEFYITVISFCVTLIVLCASFPVAISVVVDFFPTTYRSSAVSVTMLLGRMCASAGSQLYGILYQKHCEELYWGISGILVFNIIMNILAPSKRKL